LLFVFAALAVTGLAIWFYLPSNEVQSPEQLVNVMATSAGSPPEPGGHGLEGPIVSHCVGTLTPQFGTNPPGIMGCKTLDYPTSLIFAFDTSAGDDTPNFSVLQKSLPVVSQFWDGPHYVRDILPGTALPSPNIFTAYVTQQVSFRHANITEASFQLSTQYFNLTYWATVAAPSPPFTSHPDRSAYIDCKETKSVQVNVNSNSSAVVVFGCRSYKRGATVTWYINSTDPVEIEQLDKWMRTGNSTYSDKDFKITGKYKSPDGHWQPFKLGQPNVAHSSPSTSFEIEFEAKADSPDNGIQYGLFGTIEPSNKNDWD